jgi:response regulator NasT
MRRECPRAVRQGAGFVRETDGMRFANVSPVRVYVMDECDEASELLRKAGHEMVSSLSANPDVVLMDGKSAAARLGELQRLRVQLAERKLIERAKGLLMKARGLDEEAAYALLRKAAMDRNVRTGEVAQQLIDSQGLLGGA